MITRVWCLWRHVVILVRARMTQDKGLTTECPNQKSLRRLEHWSRKKLLSKVIKQSETVSCGEVFHGLVLDGYSRLTTGLVMFWYVMQMHVSPSQYFVQTF